jgi:hypothetical protein
VTTLVEGVDVEVRLERDAERIPGVSVTGEPVQEQQGGASLAAPVEQMKA